eukprot:tig00020904_g15192.t1
MPSLSCPGNAIPIVPESLTPGVTTTEAVWTIYETASKNVNDAQWYDFKPAKPGKALALRPNQYPDDALYSGFKVCCPKGTTWVVAKASNGKAHCCSGRPPKHADARDVYKATCRDSGWDFPWRHDAGPNFLGNGQFIGAFQLDSETLAVVPYAADAEAAADVNAASLEVRPARPRPDRPDPSSHEAGAWAPAPARRGALGSRSTRRPQGEDGALGEAFGAEGDGTVGYGFADESALADRLAASLL